MLKQFFKYITQSVAGMIGAGYLCFMLFSKIKERNLRFVIGAVMFVATIFLSQRNLHVDINLLRIGDSHLMFYINGILGSMGIR